MGLSSVIANAVATAKSVTDSIQVSIGLRSCSGWSGGNRTYASLTPVTYKVLMEKKEKMVRGRDKEEQLSKVQIYFLEPITLTMEDEITLPDGSKPQIMAIEGLANPSGVPYNPTVYF